MNLGQAVAVCLYELAARVDCGARPDKADADLTAAPSGRLDLLSGVVEETMRAVGYSPRTMQAANRHDLRLLLRRLTLSERDLRRVLGLFRRILWRLRHATENSGKTG
jgi:tRNA C32,U32 (ribose-2'-O)-methylase TrmJ